VLLVESIDFNLLLIAQLCDLGFKCTFGSDDVEVVSVDGSNLIFKRFRYGSLYLVDFNDNETQLTSCLLSKSSLGWLWHIKLGHVGMKQLNKLLRNCGGTNPYTITARLGLGDLAHYETVRGLIQLLGVSRKDSSWL